MLLLGECDVALAGGVSESIHTFGIFASFKSQGALASARRSDQGLAPVRRRPQWHRRGRRRAACTCWSDSSDARDRGAKIYGEIGRLRHEQRRQRFRAAQSRSGRPSACRLALRRARIDRRRGRHRQHARHRHRQRRHAGVRGPAAGIRRQQPHTRFNNTKSFIGHAMGAAGALELAGNLPAFDDGVCHADDQRRRARSRVRACRAWSSTSRESCSASTIF